MNKQQITGRLNEAAGKVQERTGRLLGSEAQEVKGDARANAGKAESSVEDLKRVLRESGRH
jgi:uncharacterized protein YjbJ (UPF0337 family)